MAIFNFVIWIIAGILSFINSIIGTVDKDYWKIMFWITYIVLMVNLIPKMFV